MNTLDLDIKAFKEITLGADRVTEDINGFNFHRFTCQQEELYKKTNIDFYKKALSTSGIMLSFKTDSDNLYMDVLVEPGSSRLYFSFDVFVNGKLLDSLKNFTDTDMVGNYVGKSLPLGEFSKNFVLGTGMKEVCIYLPWSVKAVIKKLTLDDNSTIIPIKHSRKLLCFGDSITHGYDALYPSNKYTSQLAKFLNAEEHNKAIGGEIFFPQLAALKENFVPDYITVAYGTNDWSRCKESDFIDNCYGFFKNLNTSYPNARVFVFTPIWRKNHNDITQFGSFDNVEKHIRNIVKEYDNMVVIQGINFVEHKETLFADLRLHPNDEGFKQYFNSVMIEMSKFI